MDSLTGYLNSDISLGKQYHLNAKEHKLWYFSLWEGVAIGGNTRLRLSLFAMVESICSVEEIFSSTHIERT